MATYYLSLLGAGAKTGVDSANAYDATSLQLLLDTLNTGDTGLIASGTYPLSATLTIDTNSGAANNYIKLYCADPSTWEVTDDVFVFDGENSIVNCVTQQTVLVYWDIRGMVCIRATGTGFLKSATNSAYMYLRNCGFNLCGQYGVYLANFPYISYDNCQAIGNVGFGMFISHDSVGMYIEARNNGITGVYANVIENFVLKGNVVGLVSSNGSFAHNISKGVIDGNTSHGLTVSLGSSVAKISKCRITNNGGWALNGNNTGPLILERCGFRNNTSGRVSGSGVLEVECYDLTADGYIDRPNNNLMLTSTAEYKSVEIPIGLLDGSTINKTWEAIGLNQEPIEPAMTVTDINLATGASGASIVITGTNFTGSGNIVKLGGSGGTSCTVTAQSTTEITFTVPAIATGTYDVYIENSTGGNLVVPNGFILTSAVVPVFAGITHFEILSNNKFYIKTGTATETPIYLVYYIRTATNPFGIAYSFKLAYSANKELVIGEESGHFAPLVAGTTYYCGVRAENANGMDINTAELSNICSGTAMIQRQTITVLSAK